MSNKRKKRIRAIVKKTGLTYQGASNMLAKAGDGIRAMIYTGVNAMMGDAGYDRHGCQLLSVALMQWNESQGQYKWAPHGAYPARKTAWEVGTRMVTELSGVITRRGGYTEADVFQAFRRADRSVR